MLHEFLGQHAGEILERTRAKAAQRTAPRLGATELSNGVPLFLDQLIVQLRLATSEGGAIEETATLHGAELRALGDAFIGDAEVVIGNAVKAAYKLRPLEECRARPMLALLTTAPGDPATAVQVQALAGTLDEIGALQKAGEVERGVPRARAAVTYSRAHTTCAAPRAMRTRPSSTTANRCAATWASCRPCCRTPASSASSRCWVRCCACC